MLTHLCGVGKGIPRIFRPVRVQLKRSNVAQIPKFPETTPNAVAYWLYGMSACTVIAVSLGGVTRLTESGLSMTSWHLIKDITKPTTQEEWEREFERYKQFPEYEAVHSDLTLDGFKFIYHMEWGHRNWGRGMGVLFMVPLIGFLMSKKMTTVVKKRTLGLMGLLCFQGGMGWYMVKSGLVQPEKIGYKEDTPIRVSPYRLCAHLGTAFLFLVGSLWTALDISMANRGGAAPLPDHKLTRVLKGKSLALALFTYFVAMSGAFVAGNDAGLIYGTYPKMGDHWVPNDYLSDDLNLPRNMLENGTAVQFNHRLFAHLLVAGVTSAWFMSRKAGITGRPKKAIDLCLALVFLQASMGVGCLIYNVPVELGAAHQLGSVFLLSASTWFTHEMRRGNIQKLARKIK